MKDRPYFMENKQWYKFDFKKKLFVLTDEAPKKAQESYKEYLKELRAE